MAREPNASGALTGVEQINAPGDGVDLPPTTPDAQGPPGGDDPEFERAYFHPERWDAEMVDWQESDGADPVEKDIGKQEGNAAAALFLSDFHMADGTAGGDDFLESHLAADDTVGGLYTGFFPPGESRAGLFAAVLAFARERVGRRAAEPRLDVVLHGDVINGLELKGRGGTYVSRKHRPFYRALAMLRGRAQVFWLRGNHDYVVPSGPWKRGEFYVNATLRVLAEHGDVWDKSNWPPGPGNQGSRLVLEGAAAFEVHAPVMRDGTFKYLMSGIDNVRPWSNDAVEGFLDRRGKYSDVAAMAALVARLKSVGAADDSAAYKGALERRKKKYPDWLMVQGHTHVPAAAPGVYYNTGTWMTTLVAIRGREKLVEAFPFLLVYLDPAGRRVEEYYLVTRSGPGAPARAVLQSPDTVNPLRKELGYRNSIP
jgi:UDP-2,3-diacylglucosamine pyrophosphatase LpxH